MRFFQEATSNLHLGKQLLLNGPPQTIMDDSNTWISIFSKIVSPYAELNFVILDIDYPDKLRFILMLKHLQPLKFNHSLHNTVLFDVEKATFTINSDNIAVKILNTELDEYYLTDNSSILDIDIKNIKINTENELKNKMEEIFIQIKKTIETMFTGGITLSSSIINKSWDDNEDESISKMKLLAQSLKATYEYRLPEFVSELNSSFVMLYNKN